jgi:hypothetical protein
LSRVVGGGDQEIMATATFLFRCPGGGGSGRAGVEAEELAKERGVVVREGCGLVACWLRAERDFECWGAVCREGVGWRREWLRCGGSPGNQRSLLGSRLERWLQLLCSQCWDCCEFGSFGACYGLFRRWL